MSKAVTISSLVRQAAKSEADFASTVEQVLAEEPADRIADFFDRLNVPRSIEGEALLGAIPTLDGSHAKISTFEDEGAIAAGMQKYMDRHLKKLKWHAQRPSAEGAKNVMLLMRQAMILTEVRLGRLHALLKSKDQLTPAEWSTARDLMNHGFASFKNYLTQFGGSWIDAANGQIPRAELEAILGNFYELIDGTVRKLEKHKDLIESRRQELAVVPPGFPMVKPPMYFQGDLLGRGPWKQFWIAVEDRAHHFREALA